MHYGLDSSKKYYYVHCIFFFHRCGMWVVGGISRQRALSISSSILFSYLYHHSCIGATQFLKSGVTRIMSSTRASDAERPYIEDVLDRFANRSGLTMLALGSSYWSPPPVGVN